MAESTSTDGNELVERRERANGKDNQRTKNEESSMFDGTSVIDGNALGARTGTHCPTYRNAQSDVRERTGGKARERAGGTYGSYCGMHMTRR